MVRSCIPARANKGRRIVTRGLRLEKNKMRAEIEISPDTKTRQERLCLSLGTRRPHVTFRHIRELSRLR